ncbi:hypothetical protein HNI00_15275 [Thermoleptolyngbya oregonensis NK1-22]|uniref:KGK family protein n=1 Tax=Thermoleptolyngbya oregonensis NK1-22 TaxID=2547457 RepID=A0AA97BDJ9_9CYAN|nr:hypothetical protein HNI00_15275 [Thermoleptolyngbya oregonensis NK1-22]
MSNHEFLSDFSNEDILLFHPSESQEPLPPSMMKLGRFRSGMQELFEEDLNLEHHVCSFLEKKRIQTFVAPSREVDTCWFGEGIACEVLKLGESQWRTGKIRIRVSVEFCPDELQANDVEHEDIESSFPLDEIRREEFHYPN